MYWWIREQTGRSDKLSYETPRAPPSRLRLAYTFEIGIGHYAAYSFACHICVGCVQEGAWLCSSVGACVKWLLQL